MLLHPLQALSNGVRFQLTRHMFTIVIPRCVEELFLNFFHIFKMRYLLYLFTIFTIYCICRIDLKRRKNTSVTSLVDKDDTESRK